jgi:hypothetical protein
MNQPRLLSAIPRFKKIASAETKEDMCLSREDARVHSGDAVDGPADYLTVADLSRWEEEMVRTIKRSVTY